MATPIDFSLLQVLSPIFVWMFIFALVYALVQKTKIMGDNQLVNLIISFSIATLSIFTTGVTQLISFIAPWFIFIFLFLLLLFAILMFFGIKEEVVWRELGVWTVIIISFFILLIGITQVYGNVFTPYGSTAGNQTIQSETLRTLFSPRVLGAIFILIITALATRFISHKLEKAV